MNYEFLVVCGWHTDFTGLGHAIKGLHPLLGYFALSGLSMCAFLSPERAQYISEAVSPLANTRWVFAGVRVERGLDIFNFSSSSLLCFF